jgi:hypothetical protein
LHRADIAATQYKRKKKEQGCENVVYKAPHFIFTQYISKQDIKMPGIVVHGAYLATLPAGNSLLPAVLGMACN